MPVCVHDINERWWQVPTPVFCFHLVNMRPPALPGMQSELLYKVFSAIVTGGTVCQYEDDWALYLDVAKAFYKVSSHAFLRPACCERTRPHFATSAHSPGTYHSHARD